MSPQKTYEEINSYVVFWGLFFSVLFALAVGYLCLKIGQTVDAFAPVSVLAMGMAVLFHRKNAFPETVHIQSSRVRARTSSAVRCSSCRRSTS